MFKIKRPLSKHYPVLAEPIRLSKITVKNVVYISPKYSLRKQKVSQENIFRLKTHKSLLRRRLGDSDPVLQEQKIKNLQIAADFFNDTIIKPGQILSFWKILGEPTYERGFVDGMILDNGQIRVGVGGGLCQIANLLYWLFLHSPLEVKEHHHHAMDIFPDSGRVLPFGSGAGVMYNYGDLQFENNTNFTFLLQTWVDETNLYGQISTLNQDFDLTYKIIERDHLFYENSGQIFRKNKIFRLTRQKLGGKLIEESLITENNSPVLYDITKEKMQEWNEFYHQKQLKSDLIAEQKN